MKKFNFYKTVVFDFDGVIHSYASGWHEKQSVCDIFDPPTEGIREVIKKLRETGWSVVIISARCKSFFGRRAIRKWCKKYNIEFDAVLRDKIPARCYVDDRAVCFKGDSSTLYNDIHYFHSWVDDE